MLAFHMRVFPIDSCGDCVPIVANTFDGAMRYLVEFRFGAFSADAAAIMAKDEKRIAAGPCVSVPDSLFDRFWYYVAHFVSPSFLVST